MTYNPSILKDVLRSRSLTQNQLARRLEIEPEELVRELTREQGPKQSVLNEIAKELALPAFVFYLERSPSLHDVIPDFRSETPAPTAKARETIESIQFAEGVQRAAGEGNVSPAAALPKFDVTKQDEVDAFALRARNFFGISVSDQLDSKDANAFYTVCRKRLEDKGIFVLHDSFPEADGSGFCLAHAQYPIIVVNTRRQTRGRRLFTLIHELGHVLMQRSGISDPFVRRNNVERLCNRFAGSFLVPGQFLSQLLKNATFPAEPDQEDIARAARRLKISQQASVFRLEQLKVFKAGTHDRWLMLVHNSNPDFSEKRGGSTTGPPPQEKVKLAKYGFRFASAFSPALEEDRISEINLFRSSGLKPKYQRAYFDYALSLTADELRTLELEDD